MQWFSTVSASEDCDNSETDSKDIYAAKDLYLK